MMPCWSWVLSPLKPSITLFASLPRLLWASIASTELHCFSREGFPLATFSRTRAPLRIPARP